MEISESSEVLDEDPVPSGPPKPRTLTVLGLLVVAAGTFSYLGAFAVTDALARANVIAPISHDPDPRPWWALASFVGLMTTFMAVAAVLRFLSGRQFRRIDQITEEEAVAK